MFGTAEGRYGAQAAQAFEGGEKEDALAKAGMRVEETSRAVIVMNAHCVIQVGLQHSVVVVMPYVG